MMTTNPTPPKCILCNHEATRISIFRTTHQPAPGHLRLGEAPLCADHDLEDPPTLAKLEKIVEAIYARDMN